MSSPDKKPTPLRVQDIDLDYLVSVFASNVFTSNTTDPEKVIDNDRGKLSATYPNKIVALALPAQRGEKDQRSQSTQDLFPESEGPVQPDALPSTSKVREEYEELPEGPDNPSPLPEDDASLHGELRKEDIELLKLLSVRRICDLMVEGKKEKFYLKVTSSEKVDRFQRYRDFTIFKLPYPGCEFFEKYVKQHYKPEGLFFDWTQLWDLVELTKNYLKFLLKVIVDGDSSLLVHCISGWDRTALFISMLRLSLWADNKIHQNLSALEMAYLTAAYDWFLFSGESDAETASSAGGLSDMGLEATPGLDTKSIESLPLLRMSSKHQTKEHTDIHESETTENPGGAEDGTPSNKEFSLKLRRERLEEVRLLVTRAYLNMRTTAANKKTSPRCLSAIARTFSVSSAREGWRTQ
ncbi:hypothetical protein HPB50_005579 [Hyalomma asiaticum]|uniref:Uncharacterized protein n=1 Tax=Hyalomma asiaticum TaxID=266040 RepID=A0ACB7TCQ6_HYAAI|nr:hypothetical protein HPB50_005579 [Hyalomma asiaticum]